MNCTLSNEFYPPVLRLEEEEGSSEDLNEKRKALEGKCDGFKQDIENMELSINKLEQEKQAKDNQIKTLNDEMARQDEAIAKLQKDKKNVEETLKKTQEDLQAEEDKCNHLNKLKQKLEQTIDEVSARQLLLSRLSENILMDVRFLIIPDHTELYPKNTKRVKLFFKSL